MYAGGPTTVPSSLARVSWAGKPGVFLRFNMDFELTM